LVTATSPPRIIPVRPSDLDISACRTVVDACRRRRKPFALWCDEAGLPHCSAHGLRKAGATLAAENGASAHELMSIFGWLTIKEAERYTKAAEQKRLAARAMSKLERQ
jgi:integrase